jgi:hypothetical protein
MTTPEGQIKRELKKLLSEIGAYYYMSVPMGYGKSTVDFLVCYKGQFFAIETKREGVGKPTARQACILREIAQAGGGVWLENSLGLEETRKRMGL